MKTTKHIPNVLLAVVALALIVRVVFIIYAYHNPQRTYDHDTPVYISSADYLLDEHHYPPTAFRTPGYPIFLAVLISIFGHNPFAIALVQFIIGGVTILLTYMIGIRLFHSRRPALLAALLLALSLESIISAFFLLTETLFTFLMVGAFYCLIRFQDGHHWHWVVLSGLLTGLAVFTRPIAVLYPFVGLLMIILVSSHWRSRFAGGGIYLLSVLIVLLPWMLRNYFVLGDFTITTVSSENQLYYQVTPMLAELHHQDLPTTTEELRREVEATMAQKGWTNNEVNLSKAESLVAYRYIAAYPARYAFTYLKNDFRNLLPGFGYVFNIFNIQQNRPDAFDALRLQGLIGAFESYFGNNVWTVALLLPSTLLLVFTFFCAVLGVIDLVRNRSWSVLIPLLLTVLYFLATSGGSSNSRFRVPSMPYVCLLAGIGIISLANFYTRIKEPARRVGPDLE